MNSVMDFSVKRILDDAKYLIINAAMHYREELMELRDSPESLKYLQAPANELLQELKQAENDFHFIQNEEPGYKPGHHFKVLFRDHGRILRLSLISFRKELERERETFLAQTGADHVLSEVDEQIASLEEFIAPESDRSQSK